MAVLGTVPADVTRVAALETAPVLQLPLLLLKVLVLVVLLLLDPDGHTNGWVTSACTRARRTETPRSGAPGPALTNKAQTASV